MKPCLRVFCYDKNETEGQQCLDEARSFVGNTVDAQRMLIVFEELCEVAFGVDGHIVAFPGVDEDGHVELNASERIHHKYLYLDVVNESMASYSECIETCGVDEELASKWKNGSTFLLIERQCW
jgi:hypothetical protein